MIDFRLTARRDAKAAKAFVNKAIEQVRLHRPVTICTDKARAYARVIREITHRMTRILTAPATSTESGAIIGSKAITLP